MVQYDDRNQFPQNPSNKDPPFIVSCRVSNSKSKPGSLSSFYLYLRAVIVISRKVKEEGTLLVKKFILFK
jgi:hypothetical protein